MAIVTGSSSGIGQETVLLMLRRGYCVVATVRREEDAAALAAKAEALPGRLHVRRLDVRDAEAVPQFIADAAELGPIEALVNNAGVTLGGLAEHIREDELRDVLETNFFGLWRMTMAALPHLKKARRSTVVQLSSSGGGRLALPFLSPYVASKHAVEGFSEALHYELRPHGVRVVLVEPGACRTPIVLGPDPSLVVRGDDYDRRVVERLSQRIQMVVERRGTDPQVVAQVVVRAIEHERPRLRYVVGVDARLILAVRRLMPERAFRAATQLGMRIAGYDPPPSAS